MNKGSLILDTNLLFLFVAGSARREIISSNERLRADFDIADYDILCAVMGHFETIVSLSSIIVETDYFVNKLRGPDRWLVLSRLRQFVLGTPEYPALAEKGVNSREFARLGFVDCIILEVLAEAMDRDLNLCLISNDAFLVNTASARGLEAVLFRELR